jgi:type II secretory pathway pseudopilin PulG
MLMSVLVLTGVLAAICAPGLIAQSRAEARLRDAQGDA